MRITVNSVTIGCIKGNIVEQRDLEAVVNAANAQLMAGGGVAGAIHKTAGPELAEECKPLAPIRPGEAVITGGHKLPNEYVIHCLGPVYGSDEPAEELLASCYKKALSLAEDRKIHSIGFPALSTGAFGYPMERAAEVAFRSIKESIPAVNHVKMIRFVLFDRKSQQIHEKKIKEIFSDTEYIEST